MLSFQILQIKVSLVARITVKEGQRRYGKGRRGEIGEGTREGRGGQGTGGTGDGGIKVNKE